LLTEGTSDAKDSPPHTCRLHYPSDCGSGGCIVTAIQNQTALFMDPNTDDLTRQEALMYIIHFLGDIHQPLHVENAYRGGNELHVCFRRACSRNNLHSVWDKYIPHKIVGLKTDPTHVEEKDAAKQWAGSLYSAAMAEGRVDPKAECADVHQTDSCSVPWAQEANSWVCKYVMKPGVEWLENNDLSLEYFDGAKPIVEDMIGKAGLRLASWLEAMVNGAQSAGINPEQQVLGRGEF
jgi:hypothetical protein